MLEPLYKTQIAVADYVIHGNIHDEFASINDVYTVFILGYYMSLNLISIFVLVKTFSKLI